MNKDIELPPWEFESHHHNHLFQMHFLETSFVLECHLITFYNICKHNISIQYLIFSTTLLLYTSMFSFSTKTALDQSFHPFLFIWSFPLSRHYHLDGASNLYSHQQWRRANTSWDQMQYKHIPSIHWTAATSQLTPASISVTLSIICIWKNSLAIKGINCWCSCIEAEQLLSWSV